MRISKSILQPVDFQASLKALDEFSRLACVEIDLDGTSAVAPELLDGAARLLALRSGPKGGLTLRVRWPASNTPPNAQLLDTVMRSANSAAWAGKKVDIEFRVIGVNLRQPSIRVDLCLPIASATFEYPAELNRDGLADLRTVIRLAERFPGARLVWRPRANNVAETMKALCDSGLLRLEIDVEGAYLDAGPNGTPAMADALSEAARWYAEYLAKGGRAHVGPFTELFRRVHAGEPHPRMDGAGVRSLFIQSDGSVFPSAHFVGPSYRVGNVVANEWNEDALLPFGDLGYPMTAGCARCWARNVCGGGFAAIHCARTGA
ncbi:MAG: SPASM domain-containing protein, partial [Candidatus Hydrogenedentota bacterium]